MTFKVLLVLIFLGTLEGVNPFLSVDQRFLFSSKHTSKISEGIYCSLNGRLGNQFFQASAALSLAFDKGVMAYFPDLKESRDKGIRNNASRIFFRLNSSRPFLISEIYKEDPDLLYRPIPYKPRMLISGYFQSEKFFKHNWDKISPYFEPSKDIQTFLRKKYKSLIDHPFTVAIHVRNYNGEKQEHALVYESLGRDYYDQAIEFFSDEALFVIFSDDLTHAKKIFEGLERPHLFIEGNDYVYDFFLMSMMKHSIIANSSFSWWAAYLNKNQEKVIIAPKKWFKPSFHAKSDDIVPNNWFEL